MSDPALHESRPGESPTTDPPGWVRKLAAVLSVGVGLSALALLLLAWTRGDQPYWLLSGMELCILLAAVFGLLFAMRRFQEGPGMTLACIAGSIFAPAVLGWLSLYRGPNIPVSMALTGNSSMPMTGWLIARVLVAGCFVLLAGVVVLSRNRASTRYILSAAGTGGALAVLMSGLYVARTWLQTQAVVPEWIVWTVVSLAVILAIGLFCACAHCVIRAFELGRTTSA